MSRFLLAALTVASVLCAAEEPRDPLLEKAHWIWYDRDTNGYEAPDIEDFKKSPFLFTKTVELSRPVRRAAFRITAQNVYTLTINGKKVGSDANWMSLDTYDIAPFLAVGKNAFAIQAQTRAWYAGLFFFGRIELDGGKTLEVLSDETWTCASELDKKPRQAQTVVQGVDAGFWNNCDRCVRMPETWYRLNTEVAAPGIAWAKPYAGGRVKVLALHPRSSQRDTVELIHRSDMDVAAVFTDFLATDRRTSDQRAPFFPETWRCRKDDVAADVAKALAGSRPDAILFGGLDQELFYGVAAERLKALVQSGVGLVYTQLPPRLVPVEGSKRPTRDSSFEKELTASPVAEAPPYLSTFPFRNLPGFRLGERDKVASFAKVAALFQYGKGRVVRLRLSGREGILANASDADDLNYEHYMAFAMKAVLWAAGREPAVQFKEFPTVVTASRQDAKAKGLAFTLAAPQETACSVALAVRPRERLAALPEKPVAEPGVARGERILRPMHETSADVKVGGSTPVRLPLPLLPAGDYLVDVQVSQGGKKATWASAALTMTAPVEIAELKTEPEFLDLSSGRPGKLAVTAALSQPMPEAGTLELAIVDNHDRVVQRQRLTLAAGAEQASAALKLERFATCLGKVRAELRAGSEGLDVAVARFTTVRRDWDRFGLFTTYGGWGGSRAGNVKARVMARLGIDAGFGGGTLEAQEAADIVPIAGFPAGSPRRPIDLRPEVVDEIRTKSRESISKVIRFDPVAYTCGDELNYGGGAEFPSRVADFRDALRKHYRSIKRLNEQWGTRHASFGDVYPVLADKKIAALQRAWDGMKDEQRAKAVDPARFVPLSRYLEQAAADGNYAQYIDLLRNNIRVFLERYRLYDSVAREFDPQARVGSWAPMWPWASTGHDWANFVQVMGSFAPYGRDGEISPYHSARSFASERTLLGICYGGYLYNAFARRGQLLDLEWQRWRVWTALLDGFTSIWWYAWSAGNESGLSPGFVPFPCFETARAQVEHIRRGPYVLFTRATRDPGPVAVHYSLPSRLLTSLTSDFNLRPWDMNFAIRILQNHVGMPFTFVSSGQIADGALRDHKALLMPLSQAIDADEARQLERFVRRGGVLIADVRPGLANGHGNLTDTDAMASLFGVAFDRKLGRATLTAELSGSYKGVAFKSPKWTFPADPALRLKGAEAALTVDGVPLVTSQKVGRGAAVCLNIPFNWHKGYPTPDHQYRYLGLDEHNRMLGSVVSAILEAHKIERPVRIDAPGGQWPWGLETRLHVDGKAQYVSLTKARRTKDEGPVQVTVHAPRGGHVYNLIAGAYLGEKDSWATTVQAADVQIFAVLPYQVDGLSVELEDEVVAPGGAIEGRVAVDTSRSRAERHAIAVHVVRPDGKPVRYLAQVLETRRGRASFSLPLALNEPKGVWRLSFTDAVSGRKATAEVRVK